MTCLSYLRFRYFDGDITDDEVDGFIDRGGYVLHQYSQSNFLHHIRGAWRDMRGPSEILRESTREFLKERWNTSFNSEPPPGPSVLGHLQSIDPEDYRRLSMIAAHLRAHNLAESTNGLCTRAIGFWEYAHIFTYVSRHAPRAVAFDRHLPSYRKTFRHTGLETLRRRGA